MKSIRVFIAAAVTLVVVVGGLSAPAQGQAAGNAVTEWNLIAVNTLVTLPGPAGGAPPAAAIHMGMTQGAVYDAVNAIEPIHHRPYLLKRRFSSMASKEAAVATAAYRVLSNIVSTVPERIPFPTRESVLQSLADKYAASLAAIVDSPFKTQGIAAGNAAADAMIAARQNDGRFGPSQWVPNTAPGHWWPLLNPDGTQMLDPTPWVGGVRPFLMLSSSQFRTAGPPALDSAQWAADFNEVKALGSVNSTARTPEQTYIARWWQSTPVASWNAVARDLVARENVDVVDSARLFAMQNLSAADTAINCWNDKYYWDFWRPWNAIPRAAEDGNPATEPDPTWTALITAPYPEHPSGHLCHDGAHLRVLEMFFGTDAPEGGYQITSASTLLLPTDPRTRTFSSFSQALAEIIDARIWAGLHFRTADVQAAELGRNVADYMANNYFQSVG
jgi:hypothetical protein